MSRFSWLIRDGLIAAATTLAAGLLAFGPIAADVSGRTAADLKAGGRDWAAVAIDGRDVTLTGVAPDPDLRARAVAAAEAVWGVRVVADATTVLPLAVPYPTTVERNAEGVKISGAVPDETARAALLKHAAALLPGVKIDDDLTLARGAPAAWAERVEFALARLGGLKTGAVKLAGEELSIGGEPRDWAAWRSIEDALAKSLPAGMRVALDTLFVPKPDPYRIGLTAKGGAAIVDGFLPDAAARDRLLLALRARFASVDDRMAIAPGAPAGFVDALVALAPHLARLSDLDFELTGTSAKVGGAAATAELGEAILGRIRALLPSGTVLAAARVAALPPPPQVAPAECQSALAAVQTGEKILFDTGKATLDEESTRLLDQLVATSLMCVEARITVEGHTDSQGDAEANQALSEARAKAVVDYLVAGGIAAGRLTAIGLGATRPVGDNDSDDGRQRNRRIEFRVE